jgi:hypothetical protein
MRMRTGYARRRHAYAGAFEVLRDAAQPMTVVRFGCRPASL